MYKLGVRLFHHSYPIYIEKGLFKNIEKYVMDVTEAKKIAVVTDENVDKFYGEELIKALEKKGFETKKIVVTKGESSKSFETLERVTNEMLSFGITRGDAVVALGGGVVGDLTGFAASILLRGVDFIQIPTSLLAQVDSSVGGKVAINSSLGKNLIGSFYQPIGVFIDPEMLKTLDRRYFNDGMAEVIKYGCIYDEELFNDLLRYNEKELYKNIEKVIYTCCNIKRQVVEKDERDTGERMLLNFGHTIGHAIEKYYDYKSFSHGEAVGIGMRMITEMSEKMGETQIGCSEKIKKILRKYGLPVLVEIEDKEKILSSIGFDKKNVGKNLNIILLNKIGSAYIKKIDSKDVEKYIDFN